MMCGVDIIRKGMSHICLKLIVLILGGGMMRYELNFDEDKVNDVLVVGGASYDLKGCCELLNEQQELIEELQASDEMGWKRAEMFEKKCPKKLHNKKMYIKRLEYKVQKFKEENEQLKKARDESDKFIAKKGLGAEFLNWCVKNE